MKKLLLLLMMYPLMTVAGGKGVLITHTDGSTTFLPMEKGQEIIANFIDYTTMKFSGEGIGDIEISAPDVLFFKIAEETVGISNPKVGHVAMHISNNGISLAGLLVGTKVTMLNVNGMLVNSSVADTNGCISIDLSHLGSGVYIIKVENNKSYKLLKK